MRQPYIDSFGILRVPWLRGQVMSTWDAHGFQTDKKAVEFWRPVDCPRKDGKEFSPMGWLIATTRLWETMGGIYTGYEDNRYRIDERETDTEKLVAHYIDLQERLCWGSEDAILRGWKSHQWGANIIKRFGISDRQVKRAIFKRAEELWEESTCNDIDNP